MPVRKSRLPAIFAPILVVAILGIGLAPISYLRRGNTVVANPPVGEAENKIRIHVYVKLDPPPENAINGITYELREGIPTEVGVYRSYSPAYYKSHSPGYWHYERLDTIPLEEVDEFTLYGAKSVNKTNPVLVYEHDNLRMYENALCVGYPGIKYVGAPIDGITFVRIDQSMEEATVTVYYWEGSAPIPPESTNWQAIIIFSSLFIVLIAIIVQLVRRVWLVM